MGNGVCCNLASGLHLARTGPHPEASEEKLVTKPQEDFFSRVYRLKTGADTQQFYSDWATTYESDVTRNGYESPRRCASALAQCVENKSAPLLDFGCGTGLSGQALLEAGFSNVSGTDINPEMLSAAQSKSVYRNLILASVEDPVPENIGSFGAIAAIGAIGIGAAPAAVLARLLESMRRSALLVMSLNDHTLQHPEFADAIARFTRIGSHELVFEKNGPHLTRLALCSRVYVLRRVG